MSKINDYPKIGIRPIIDGRLGGVRESLEEITMNMAKNVAKLFKNELKYPDGAAYECVIADSCIGGVKEATECDKKFRAENVGVSLSVTPCWAYGTETMDVDPHLPKAIWGFNSTQRPGAVYLAATLAAHNQKDCPPLVFMAVTCRIWTIRTSRKTYNKNCWVLQGLGWPLRSCAVNLIWP